MLLGVCSIWNVCHVNVLDAAAVVFWTLPFGMKIQICQSTLRKLKNCWETFEKVSSTSPLLVILLEDFSDTQWLLDNYNCLTIIFEYRRSPSEPGVSHYRWNLTIGMFKGLTLPNSKGGVERGVELRQMRRCRILQFCNFAYAIYQQYRLHWICCMSSLPLLDGMLAVDISTAAAVLASQQLNCAFS